MPTKKEMQINRDKAVGEILKLVIEIKEMLSESKDSESTKKRD